MNQRLRQLIVVLLGVLCVLGLASPSAHADDGTTITVNVQNRVGSTKEPVPGVGVTVTDETGTKVGAAVTDAKGVAVVPVPAPTKYTVTLDDKTFPKGVSMAGGGSLTKTVDFAVGVSLGTGGKTVNFFLGKDARKTKSRLALLPQVLINGLKFSLLYAMCAVGLSMIYGTTGLSNFAHGEIVTIGAIVTWYMNQRGPKLHLLLAAPFGIAASMLAAGALERQIWRPLRRRGMSLTSMMIMSIGMAIGVRYIYLFFFGGRNLRFRQYVGDPEIDFRWFGITPRDLVIMIVSLILVIAVSLFLLRTRRGKAIRAVADNPDLASATGINTNYIILFVWLLGGALAGIGGVMLGATSGVAWDMGFNILLILFAAITVGGLGNPFGALVGAFIVGMATELWTWIFPDVIELKNMAALASLVLVLIVRPQGILGKKERIG